MVGSSPCLLQFVPAVIIHLAQNYAQYFDVFTRVLGQCVGFVLLVQRFKNRCCCVIIILYKPRGKAYCVLSIIFRESVCSDISGIQSSCVISTVLLGHSL